MKRAEREERVEGKRTERTDGERRGDDQTRRAGKRNRQQIIQSMIAWLTACSFNLLLFFSSDPTPTTHEHQHLPTLAPLPLLPSQSRQPAHIYSQTTLTYRIPPTFL